MKLQVLTDAMLLLVLLFATPAPSETLRGQAGTPKRQPGSVGTREDPGPPRDGGDNLPERVMKGSHSSAGAKEAMEEVSSMKAMANPLLGRDKQELPSSLYRLPLQPSRSRSLRLSHHLKGHGRFNGDTHSCHNIQSRHCQKPSDCGGCLGLYTCKLPAGTCDLKAVSRQRGGFLQSIQSPKGHRVLLIP